jgi:hypothetical protein
MNRDGIGAATLRVQMNEIRVSGFLAQHESRLTIPEGISEQFSRPEPLNRVLLFPRGMKVIAWFFVFHDERPQLARAHIGARKPIIAQPSI